MTLYEEPDEPFEVFGFILKSRTESIRTSDVDFQEDSP